MSDALGHFPFLPESIGALTVGTFLSGNAEDDLIAAVWRLRRWNFYGDLTWHPFDEGGTGGPAINCFVVANPSYINMGESNLVGFETSAFSSLDDILEAWRQTRSVTDGVNGSTAGVDIWFGPRGGYDTTGNPAVGGALDSELLFIFENGDDVYYLGTQEGRIINANDPPNALNQAADIDFTYTDPGGNETAVALFFDDQEISPGVLKTDNWTGSLILKPGDLWWPWTIAGTATYDTATGEQLRNPLRNDSSGFPLAYLAQQA